MGLLQVLSLFMLLGSVISEEGSLVQPCTTKDLECLSKSTEKFMKGTAAGIPEYGIKPIDPLVLDMVCVGGGTDVMLHYKNATITGLKDFKVKEFTIDLDKKTVVLTSEGPVNVAANLVVELSDVSKTFSGTYSGIATVAATARYSYELKKDDKGVEHFEIGPENRSCEALSVPEVTIGRELQDALDNDVDANSKKAAFYANKDIIRKKSLCEITNEAFITVFYNLRGSAKVLPKTAFFTDI